ncbi:hypothetical protein [Parasediminibacterium sp. JCM 36343]|uniref:hypothetical protein n=1 Tax=Parasediminibacterium sp. JCM 36343 TaxID=3374279 RepID=UPI003978B8A9
MKRLVAPAVFILSFLLANAAQAQDTLPKFNVRDVNSTKLLITWINPYEYNCIQLAVQRSFDSTHFFSTIYSAQSPELPQNGVLDARMPKGVKVYYRIFYVLDGGQYFFTKSVGIASNYISLQNTVGGGLAQSPKKNSQREIGATIAAENANAQNPLEKKWITIYKGNRSDIYEKVGYNDFKRFRDSIISYTKDTLYSANEYEVIIKPYIPRPTWKPSLYVFTGSDNFVSLHLPLSKIHKYRIVFYEEDGTEIFQIKQLKEPDLELDNTNFVHAGWFYFDLFEDEKLKEHGKFQILLPF